ncbi:hypothetical protein PV08_06043 [Exophiala spinifera]|uniref:RRM domain-containing protein n=1 Tax=Exophiala spinifera TaxID=91928 RepID=A0A0D1ZT99_9EURO|nr:uncharacterized protein PV08_06043 [Exophiala spinifera]KIW15992.1 hypothetical protein PV08_06043 [Exophiala spinifera]
MARKRPHDQVEPDVATYPESTTTEKTSSVKTHQAGKPKGQSRQERSERRSKKQKKSADQPEPTNNFVAEISNKDTHQEAEESKPAVAGSPAEGPRKKQKSRDQKVEKTPSRFIVFVGNLPFDATTVQIKQHFSKLAPTSVRMSTDKSTGRSKGFAFLEFDDYDKMKTCLKLYHHSIFDPQRQSSAEAKDVLSDEKSKGRRINVELTAGGGGKSKVRKEKIKMKNKKLGEERERQRIKAKTETDNAARKKREAPGTGPNADTMMVPEDNRGAIHPSRLSRVQH